MGRAVRDADDAFADVPVVIRPPVERPREVRVEERGPDVLVAVERDGRGVRREQLPAHSSRPTVMARVGQLNAASSSTSRAVVSAPGCGTDTFFVVSIRNAFGARRA